ncbi:MAG: preprotein translocase subunit YajC [Planctomycetota bacterium]|nr:MAG: preprotein translocase subunit YajC [Planctomycetota bacterium]
MLHPFLMSLLAIEGEQAQESPGFPWPLFIGIGAIFYFILIRPASKDRKRRETLLDNLSKGDKVLTSSGIFGTVAQVQDNVVTLQVADGVRLRFSKSSIQGLVEEEGVKPATEK